MCFGPGELAVWAGSNLGANRTFQIVLIVARRGATPVNYGFRYLGSTLTQLPKADLSTSCTTLKNHG